MCDIRTFLQEIAVGLREFDAQSIAPIVKHGPNKGKKSYPAGAGSHEEPDQVLAVANKYGWDANNIKYCQGTCDLHEYGIWAEIKLIRPFNANGTPERNIEGTAHRVVEDARKLSFATECDKKMVVAFAYDKIWKARQRCRSFWMFKFSHAVAESHWQTRLSSLSGPSCIRFINSDGSSAWNCCEKR